MKQYFLARLINLTYICGFVLLIIILLDQIFKSNELVETIRYPVACSGLFLFTLFKTNWYILSPYSRKKLWVFHIFESIVQLLLLSIFVYVMKIYFDLRHYKETLDLRLFFIVGLVGVYFRGALPIKQERMAAYSSPGWPEFVKQTVKPGLIFGLIFVLADILGPNIGVAIIAVGICFIPYAGLWALATPKLFLKRIKIFGTVSSLLIYAMATIWSIWFLNNGSILDRRTYGNAMMAPRFLSVSGERAKELFLRDSQHYWDKVVEKKEAFIKDISFSDWRTRTVNCKSNGCLRLSEDIFPNDIGKSDVFDANATILTSCQKLKRTCLNPETIESRRKWASKWLSELVDSGEVDQWLKSTDTDKQVFAMKSLNDRELTANQITSIQKLTNSRDEIVRNTAIFELGLHKTRDKSRPTCDKTNSCNPGSFLAVTSAEDRE